MSQQRPDQVSGPVSRPGFQPRPDLGPETVRWLGTLFVAGVLLQRIAVPGMPVAILLPLVLAGGLWGVLRGLAEVNPSRLLLWLGTACVTAILVAFQGTVLGRPYVSVGSWGLFMVVWLPAVLQLVDRRMTTYLGLLRVVTATTACLAAGAVAMTATQYAGLPYRDYVAEVLPGSMVMQNFVTTYPVAYGSPIYRSNAWIGLEPSMVSLQMGVGLIAALLVGARRSVIALLVVGLVAATSGSGVLIVAVALLILLTSSVRRHLTRYLLPAAVVMMIGAGSPMGSSILNRVGEGSSQQSSLSLRAILPYDYLWPTWISDFSHVLLGVGPGSSQVLVEQSGMLGLMVPTPIKIFFDYGLVAGAPLAALMALAFVGGPSRAIAGSLFFSLWTLQPGTTQMLLVLPVLVLVTWWSPRASARSLETIGLDRIRDVAEREGTPERRAEDESDGWPGAEVRR